MTKREILALINEFIADEKGRAVTMDDLFADAQLDSLGTLIVIMNIDAEFDIYDQESSIEYVEALGLPTITIRELIKKCLSPIKESVM
jgi:acyl carrier protein